MNKEKRHDEKKKNIIECLNRYKDENGNIDMTVFREKESSAYTRISYYFGSIENALNEINLTPIEKSASQGSPINRLTLRNELAFDMLVELRKTKTLEEIGKIYGNVSRAHVNQLYQSLEMSVVAHRKGRNVDIKV